MKHFVEFIILLAALSTSHIYAQDDTLFDNYNIGEDDRHYIRTLNQEFETHSSTFPLPPTDESNETEARLNRIYSLGFTQTPLEFMLLTYTDISGLNVPDREVHSPHFSYVPHRRLTGEDVLRIIARLLADKGLGLVKINADTARVYGMNALPKDRKGLPPLLIPLTDARDDE